MLPQPDRGSDDHYQSAAESPLNQQLELGTYFIRILVLLPSSLSHRSTTINRMEAKMEIGRKGRNTVAGIAQAIYPSDLSRFRSGITNWIVYSLANFTMYSFIPILPSFSLIL